MRSRLSGALKKGIDHARKFLENTINDITNAAVAGLYGELLDHSCFNSLLSIQKVFTLNLGEVVEPM